MKSYKAILITGASSGLGRELAIQYAKSGVILYLTARNKTRLLETVVSCETRGANVLSKSIDVRDKETLKNWILDCDKIKSIDLVIANAGISAGTLDSVKPDKQVYEIYETNIIGMLNTIEPLIPLMKNRQSGQIVLISSMASFIGMASCPAYSSSKACITSYGEGLRGCLKYHNVGVSIVCPGFIKTPLTDKNQFIMPFIISPQKAAKKIIKGISKNKGLITFPFCTYVFLKLLKLFPFSWVNYLFSLLPKKEN